MIHLEHDYQGSDYLANFKALNPSPVDFGGIYFTSYLQSVTKNLAVGFESLHQRASGMMDTSTSYLAKYMGSDEDWIAMAQLDSAGKVSALLEQHFTPTFTFLIGGEINHFKVFRPGSLTWAMANLSHRMPHELAWV